MVFPSFSPRFFGRAKWISQFVLDPSSQRLAKDNTNLCVRIWVLEPKPPPQHHAQLGHPPNTATRSRTNCRQRTTNIFTTTYTTTTTPRSHDNHLGHTADTCPNTTTTRYHTSRHQSTIAT